MRKLHGSDPIAWVVAFFLLWGCQGVREFVRDPAGDDRIFTGDAGAFVNKEVIVQFRWGDPRVYDEAIPCVVLDVEENAILVRALHMHSTGYERSYSKLQELGKLHPVEGQAKVFRIRRDDIARIFESGTVLQSR